MGVLPKEVVREIIKENNFQTPQEIMKFLKDSFKDILQEMLEAEMDVHLGYSKGEKPPANSDNTRNGYSSKTVRSELGPVELNIPRDRKGEYNCFLQMKIPHFCKMGAGKFASSLQHYNCIFQSCQGFANAHCCYSVIMSY